MELKNDVNRHFMMQGEAHNVLPTGKGKKKNKASFFDEDILLSSPKEQ